MLWVILYQLKSRKAATRRRAVEQLCEAPNPRAVRILAALLRDEDAEVRRLTVVALGKIEDPSTTEPLLAALRDQDAEVLKAAIQSLKQCVEDRFATALVPLLRHSDMGVRGYAAQALDRLSWHPSSREDEVWLLTAKGRFSQAAALGVAALSALESVIASGTPSLRIGAIKALARIRDQRAARAMLAALQGEDAAVCVAALDALSQAGGPETMPAIIPMLSHQASHVRVAAIEALSKLELAAAAEALRPSLRDQVWDVRRAAAEALGRLRDLGAVDALCESLSDRDDDVREASAIALGIIGDRRAIGALVLALRDPHSSVRRLAAASLSRIDPNWSAAPEAQATVEKLKSATHDGDTNVQHFVSHLLVNPAEPAASDDLSNTTMTTRGKLAVSLFLAVLCDSDRDLRLAAAVSLGRLGDPRACSALNRALGDGDPMVREAAEQALRSLDAGSDTRKFRRRQEMENQG
jgi:HEAT repeat protein